MATNEMIVTNIKNMKRIVNGDEMKRRVSEMLGREAGTFLASALDLYTGDRYLSQCNPNDVMKECLKAAALNLPINKSLGFAYVVPYKNMPQFQMGYRGMIQLAQRSGQYKYINADCVYEGMEITKDWLTGMVTIEGEPTSDKVIGYFAYFQLINGFEKCVYMTREQVLAHAKRFSKALGKDGSPWQEHFDQMARKTVLKQLIATYGPMNVTMADALSSDTTADERADAEIAKNANGDAMRMPEVVGTFTEDDPAEAQQPEQPVQEQPPFDDEEDPGF